MRQRLGSGIRGSARDGDQTVALCTLGSRARDCQDRALDRVRNRLPSKLGTALERLLQRGAVNRRTLVDDVDEHLDAAAQQLAEDDARVAPCAHQRTT